MTHYTNTRNPIDFPKKKNIPLLEKFAAQSLVEYNGELIFSKERFAELIVRECIGCCEQVISDPVPESVDTWLNGGEQCIQEIKQHFGLGMSVADKKQLIKDLLGVNNVQDTSKPTTNVE